MTIGNLRNKIFFFLRTTLQVREGELQRTLLMQANIFLIITTLLIVKPVVNGLFLARFGAENLPYAFLLVAVVAAIVSTMYSRFLKQFALNKLLIATIYGSVICLVTFGLFLRLNFLVGITLYVFYIWVAIFALLTTSQFWVMANIVFNVREAKRLFGLIGAGAIAGGIFGGYLTSLLVSFGSSEYLPFLCAGLLSLCIPITQRLWQSEVKEKQTLFQQKKKVKVVSDHPFVMIRQSRHLSTIASIVGVGVIVAKLVDYQFSAIVSSIIEDPDELTSFFGFWFSTFNVFSLLMQIFVTRRVVGNFGVGYSLLILPLSILIATLLLIIMPELLIAAIFLKMADGGLKQSINKAAMELLIIPIPQDVKNQTKTFIDVFIDSLATGFSGLILIFFIKGLDLSTSAINLLVLFFLFLWLYLVFRVRVAYIHSFREKMKNESGAELQFEVRNESVIGGIKKILLTGTDKQRLFLLKKIKENPDERFIDEFISLLKHPNKDIRVEAIRNLYFFKQFERLEEIEAMIHDTSQKVKIAVFEYLINHAVEDRIELLNKYIKHENYKISSTCLVSLARETRNNPKLRSLFRLEAVIQQRLDGLATIDNLNQKRFCTIGLIKAIGYSGITNFYPFIAKQLQIKQPEYISHAIKAAGETMHPQFIDLLVTMLGNQKLFLQVREALLFYGKGVLDVLISVFRDMNTDSDIKRVIPRVIKYIDSQKSVDFLFELLDNQDPFIRRESLRGLNHLRIHFPHLTFHKKSIVSRIMTEVRLYQETLAVLHFQNTLSDSPRDKNSSQIREILIARVDLVKILERRVDENLERIFRLLGLKYPPVDIFSIFKGLHSEKEDIRLNAIEFLDNLIDPGLKKNLIPLIESTILMTISEDSIKDLKIKVTTEKECLIRLLNHPSLDIRNSVLNLIEKLGDHSYISILEEKMAGSSASFQLAIKKVMDRISGNDLKKTEVD